MHEKIKNKFHFYIVFIINSAFVVTSNNVSIKPDNFQNIFGGRALVNMLFQKPFYVL